MIKIERMTEGCIATVNDKQIFVGQLINFTEYEALKVTAGTVTVSIDELEVKDIVAAPAPAPAPASAPAATTKPKAA